MAEQVEKAILAGGCFWGMEDLVRVQPGVLDTRVGYTGGTNAHATYRSHPGHAEAIEIVFDPAKTSYRDILAFFFQIHDPSTLDRQGNDIGSRLFEETAEFVKDAYVRTMKDSGTVVRRNLAPFRDSLLPKLRSFQLLDSRCRPAADLLEQMLTQAEHVLNQIPRGQERGLAGSDYDQFMGVFRVFLSADLLEAHVAAHRSSTPTLTAMPTPSLPPTQPANTVRLTKRPMPAALPSPVSSVPRRPVISF